MMVVAGMVWYGALTSKTDSDTNAAGGKPITDKKTPTNSSVLLANDGSKSKQQPAVGKKSAAKPWRPTPKPPRTFRRYRFDDENIRWKNVGGNGREASNTGEGEHLLHTRGSFMFTDLADRGFMGLASWVVGTGVRFTDGVHGEALLPSKTWLYNAQWTLPLWFRRASSTNDDFLVHLG